MSLSVQQLATIRLSAQQLILALEALREYQELLERSLRHRRALDEPVRARHQLTRELSTALSIAYVNLDTE